MAYDVTSQWDDIHRQLGNYEPLPVEKTQKEFTEENIQKLEQLTKDQKEAKINQMVQKEADKGSRRVTPVKDSDSDFDSDDDDDFFEEYKRKRLAQMKNEMDSKLQHLDQAEPEFGFVRMIGKQEYIRQVNEAGEGVDVILHLFKDSVDECVQINRVLDSLAPQFPKVKFLKGISDKIVPNFPDRQLPYLLYYRDGAMKKGLQRLEFKMSIKKITEFSIRQMFYTLGVKALKIDREKPSVKGEWRDKMGWKRKQHREDFDSDDEDRDFISNRINYK